MAYLSDKKERVCSQDRLSGLHSESGKASDGEKQKHHLSNEIGDIEVVDWEGRDDPANPSAFHISIPSSTHD